MPLLRARAAKRRATAGCLGPARPARPAHQPLLSVHAAGAAGGTVPRSLLARAGCVCSTRPTCADAAVLRALLMLWGTATGAHKRGQAAGLGAEAGARFCCVVPLAKSALVRRTRCKR